MKIVLASDHAGFKLKESVKKYLLLNKKIEIIDLGVDSEVSVDYPLYGIKAGEFIRDNMADKGIIICGTGIGISIAANKVKGVRAALCYDKFTAEMSRKHNDANVLALGARTLNNEQAFNLIDIWLNTEFEGGRHQRRVEQLG